MGGPDGKAVARGRMNCRLSKAIDRANLWRKKERCHKKWVIHLAQISLLGPSSIEQPATCRRSRYPALGSGALDLLAPEPGLVNFGTRFRGCHADVPKLVVGQIAQIASCLSLFEIGQKRCQCRPQESWFSLVFVHAWHHCRRSFDINCHLHIPQARLIGHGLGCTGACCEGSLWS